jgi:mRNA interferase RelE/StbE
MWHYLSERFEIIMDPDAAKEHQKLDNSVISIVDKALSRLGKRADGIGKPLRNQANSKLAGCKEIKLREAGIRMAFKVTNQVVRVLRVVCEPAGPGGSFEY